MGGNSLKRMKTMWWFVRRKFGISLLSLWVLLKLQDRNYFDLSEVCLIYKDL